MFSLKNSTPLVPTGTGYVDMAMTTQNATATFGGLTLTIKEKLRNKVLGCDKVSNSIIFIKLIKFKFIKIAFLNSGLP